MKRYTSVFASAAVAVAFTVIPAMAMADTVNVNFEPPTYTVGTINGQDGWLKTGPYDVNVTATGVPAGFGTQSMQISDAVTSGSFGDQAFAKPLLNAVGETAATAGPFSVGTKQTHFEMQFDIAATTTQPGLFMSVSPDRGDGSRMSYLGFLDTVNGIDVSFYDVQGTSNPANFVQTDLGTYSGSVPHTIKLTMDTIDGPSNDVVKVYIDGVLVHTGTSWENYYRYDSEASAEPTPRIVKTVLFRAGGTAIPADAGKGYLIDNLSLSSGPTPAPTTVVVTAPDLDNASSSPAVVAADGLNKWFMYNDSNDTVDNTLGSFVTGPASPFYGTGSVAFTLGANPLDRKNIATYQFAGTPLSSIAQMSFGTYSHSGVAGATEDPFLNFNVDFTGSSTAWQKRLVYVPSVNGAVTQDVWQKWDAISGGNALWSYSGAVWPTATAGPDNGVVGTPGTTAKTWSRIMADYPNARILPGDGWLGIRVGEPGPANYTANVDFFSIATSTGGTVYDFEPTALPSTVKVTIDKFIGGSMATAGSAGGSAFPMSATWSATNLGSGSGSYALGTTGFNSPNPYEAVTADMTAGASYATHEVTGGAVVGADCTTGDPYALVGYSSGPSPAAAASSTATTTAPSFSNLTQNEYVIVWNRICLPAPALVSPANNSATTTAGLVMADWTDVTGPVGGITYVYQVSHATTTNPDGSFFSPVYTSGPLATSSIPTPGTPAGVYYWHVKATDADGNVSPWSEIWKFTIDNTVPSVPPPPANACATPTVAPAGYTLRDGTFGSDTVILAPFTMFVGRGGNDKVTAPDGNYIVCTGAGNDTISLGNGDDVINAGNGNNTVTTGNGAGPITTGTGNDTITTGNGAHTINAGNGNNTVTTGDGVQDVTAGAGNDKITTGSGNDVINAGNGNNTVKAGAGDDTIAAGSGNDVIDGGSGTDTCYAGGGHNTVTNCELP